MKTTCYATKTVITAMRKRHYLLITLLAGALMPFTASAFIDERTPPPPKASFTPAGQSSASAASSTPSVQAASAPALFGVSDEAAASNFSPGVMGDFNNQVWQTIYPGPFGMMPLADALIAQIVPVVGQAIEINASPEVLERRVLVPRDKNRLDTLREMAVAHTVGIHIEGNQVSIATPWGATEKIAESTNTEGQEVVAISAPGTATTDGVTSPAPRLSKTWRIEPGGMLSSALLDWAEQWGWQLVWKADVDYRIVAPIELNVDFLGGVEQVLNAYRQANRPLLGDWNDTQKVLVVREPTG